MSDSVVDKKLRAVELLIQSGSVREVAQKVGRSERTVQRWMREPDFATALAEARREYLRHGISRLCGMLGRAIDVLSSALAGSEIQKNVFLASKLVVEVGLQIQQADFDLRITQIEERIAEDRRQRAAQERRSEIEYLNSLSAEQLRAALRSRISAEENP